MHPPKPYFNPRPPQGERPDPSTKVFSDSVFQSTPPARGATSVNAASLYNILISIHAPRKGSDKNRPQKCSCCRNFNPRPPQGERRMHSISAERNGSFQSTPPARGATKAYIERWEYQWISIHAPRKGSDKRVYAGDCKALYFNPRPPQGERLLEALVELAGGGFQSTPPARGATCYEIQPCGKIFISIHAPRKGSDRRLRGHG